MSRLLSSIVLAGALAISMSSGASARDGRDGDRHGDRGMRHAPVCKMVQHCVTKKRLFKRNKTVCTMQRVCEPSHRGHH